MIAPHNCKHAGQDDLHGDGNRVWNSTKEGRRCSACGGEVADTRAKEKYK